MSLLAEFKRRNVIRMAGLYLVGSWLIIQIAETLLPAFDVPGWVLRATIILLAIGFLPALVFSWIFELTPEGLKRDGEVAPGESVAPHTAKRMDRLLLVGMLAVMGVIAADRWWPREALESAGSSDSMVAIQPASAAADVDSAAAAPRTQPIAQPVAQGIAQPVAQGIAVLPFANLSADPEQAFFADGITEDILTRLAGIEGLRVISRTSVMRYKGTTLALPQIAAELGVTHVLEGSVRRAGDRVRITGQLIRAADDDHLWAETFDRDLEDIFAVQSEIAGRIVEALELQLSDRDTQRLVQRGTDNVRAYEHYLRGRAVFSRSISSPKEGAALADEALRWFRAALGEDPDYASAEAGVARALLFNVRHAAVPQRPELLAAAIEAARRAIRLAPELADGYVQLGYAQQDAGDADAAFEQFQRAAGIAPNDPDTAAALSELHSNRGELLDAIRLARHVLALEPLEANRHDRLSWLYRQIGLLDEASAGYQRAWGELTPHPARREGMTGAVAAIQGDYERARAAIERARGLEPDSPFLANTAIPVLMAQRDAASVQKLIDGPLAEYFESKNPLSIAWAVRQTGDTARLERLLAAAERQNRDELPRPSAPWLAFRLGEIAALRGQPEQALAFLKDAVEKGWRSYRWLAVDAAWDSLRDDPRFIALEQQVDADLARMRAELSKQDAAR